MTLSDNATLPSSSERSQAIDDFIFYGFAPRFGTARMSSIFVILVHANVALARKAFVGTLSRPVFVDLIESGVAHFFGLYFWEVILALLCVACPP